MKTDGRSGQGAEGKAHRAKGSKLKGLWKLKLSEFGRQEKKPWNSREYLSSSNKLADVWIWKAVAEFQGIRWIGSKAIYVPQRLL